MRLKFQKVQNNRSNQRSFFRYTNTCHVPNTGKSHAFRFIKTPYLDKLVCFLVPWRLTVEINIPYQPLISEKFVFENNLANACASTTMFP